MSFFTEKSKCGASMSVDNTLQQELINNAGVNYFCGGAISNAAMTNRRGKVCELTYEDLWKIRRILLDNHVHKIYTKHIGCWNLCCPPEFRNTLMTMKDTFDRQAFIPVQKYGTAENTVEGEIGHIIDFRIVEVPDMFRWEDAGDFISEVVPVSDTEGHGRCVPAQEDGVDNTYINNGSRYTVFPLLIIGKDSFVKANFRNGKNCYRFHQGLAVDDPYVNHLTSSILRQNGTLIIHPERLMRIHTLARQ